MNAHTVSVIQLFIRLLSTNITCPEHRHKTAQKDNIMQAIELGKVYTVNLMGGLGANSEIRIESYYASDRMFCYQFVHDGVFLGIKRYILASNLEEALRLVDVKEK
jgi:hypothetical protein